MKTRLTLNLLCALALTCVSTSFGATKYWTGTGTWNAANANWGNATSGPYDSVWGNATADTAVFEGTSGDVTVGQSLNVGNLTFTTSGYQLNSASATTLTGPAAITVNLAAGVTANIGSNVTFTTSTTNTGFNLIGGNVSTSVLNVGGTIKNTTQNNNGFYGLTANITTGGLIQSANSMFLGANSAGSNATAVGASLIISGGDYKNTSASGGIIIGGMGATSTNNLKVTSGNLTFTNAANTSGIRFGSTSTLPATQVTTVVDFDGGTTTVGKIFMGGSYTGGASYNATINFNGGTLRPLGNQTAFMEGITGTGAVVKSGGAKIDTNGFNITVGQPLAHETGLLTADGGLEKLGAGTLTLSGSSTYNGTTTITAGSLKLGAAERIANSSNVSIASGTTFNANGFSESVGTLLLTGSSTLDLGAGGSNTLAFANSSALDWSTFTLTVSNWSGTNFLRFGTDSAGLTAGQLANINFTGFGTGAAIDASGFVTAVPEPGTWIMVGIGLTFLLYRRRFSDKSGRAG